MRVRRKETHGTVFFSAADSNATHTDKSDTASESVEGNASNASLWHQRDYRAWFAADTSLMIGSLIGALAFDLLGYTVSHDTAIAGLAATTYALARGAAHWPAAGLPTMRTARSSWSPED